MNFKRKLPDCATYWGSPTTGGYGGAVFSPPTTVKVRWEDKQEKFLTATGDEAVSRAVVFVESDVEIGGYLYFGELLPSEVDPTQIVGAHIIRQFLKTPDIQGLQHLRRAFL